MLLKIRGAAESRINNLIKKKRSVIIKTYPVKAEYFHLQDDFYGGNGVFFNKDRNRESRYAIPDRSKGAIYVTDLPLTACAEKYKGERFIDLEDYRKNCIAIVTPVRNMDIVDLTVLAPLLHMPVGELMGGDYRNTQALAAVLSLHADGLEYLSRMTGRRCAVFWCADTSGKGLIATKSVKRLPDFRYQGVTAVDMLKNQLDIRIIG